MKCSRCKRKAVTEIKHEKQALCGRCFLKVYEARVRRTIRNNGMIDKRDKVMCAVSGGKDSLSMLHFMKKRRQNMVAVSIDEGINGYRDKTIDHARKFCEKKDIPFHVFSFKDEYGFTMDDVVSLGEKTKRINGKPTCSYCGTLRRSMLNRKARELECDKVAIGHNLDDEAQTIIMNFYRSELKRLATCGPITGLIKDKLFVPRIKPLRECSEKENIVYALLNKIDFCEVECPNRAPAYRNTVREQLSTMEHKYPGTKYAVLRNLDNLLPVLHEHFGKQRLELKKCKECGEIARNDTCKTCEMVTDIKEKLV